MKLNSKFTQTLGKVTKSLSKNSPLLLTVAGVVGLGATAVLAYKSKDKVEEVIEKMEEQKEIQEEIEALDQEITNPEDRLSDAEYNEKMEMLAELNSNLVVYSKGAIVRDLAAAVALPAITGVASITAIALSYYIQNNRIMSLAAAVATSSAENVYFKRKYKKEYGEEKYNEFVNTEKKTVVVKDSKGKEKEQEVAVRDMTDSLTSVWYDESCHYVSDDWDYNMQYIKSQIDSIDLRLFRKGYLLLNEVYDALGVPRTKYGAMLGWSTGDFKPEINVVHAWDKEEQRVKPEIIIQWEHPKMIYDTVDYEETLLGVM